MNRFELNRTDAAEIAPLGSRDKDDLTALQVIDLPRPLDRHLAPAGGCALNDLVQGSAKRIIPENANRELTAAAFFWAARMRPFPRWPVARSDYSHSTPTPKNKCSALSHFSR